MRLHTFSPDLWKPRLKALSQCLVLSLLFLPIAALAQNANEIVLEAECAEYSDAWTIIDDANASLGQALTIAEGNSSPNPPTDTTAYLRFRVNVEVAGTYYIWGRVLAQSASEDSFWVRVNEGEWNNWNLIADGPEYVWRKVHNLTEELVKDFLVVDLEPGETIIEFALRESNTILDKIVVSEQDLSPSGFGPLSQNCGAINPCGFSEIVYVDASATGNANGASWSDAFTSLADALDFVKSCDEAEEIWMADGVYYPARIVNENIELSTFPDTLRLYAGFQGNEISRNERDASANATIISGDILQSGNSDDYLSQLVPLDTLGDNESTYNLLIDGVRFQKAPMVLKTDAGNFTFRFGNFSELTNGFHIEGQTILRITDSKFENNLGCIMGVSGSRNVDLNRVEFENNTTSNGIFELADFALVEVFDAEFKNNQGDISVVASLINQAGLRLERCRVFDNNATEGAVLYNNGGRLRLVNTLFGAFSGVLGDIYMISTNENVLANANIINCTFSEAAADNLCIFEYSNVNATNTLFNSLGLDGQGGINLDTLGTLNLSHCLLRVDAICTNERVDCENVVIGDPLFTDPIAGDYSLLPSSPAINAGTNDAWTGTNFPIDINREDRIQEDIVDIGAFENLADIIIPPVEGVIYVDIDATGNNDGSSWEDAYNNLQDAITSFQGEGDEEIWVAEGTYFPGETIPTAMGNDAAFYSQQVLKMYGGFAGNEFERGQRKPQTRLSILDGAMGTPSDTTDDAEVILEFNYVQAENQSPSFIDGFVFTGPISRGIFHQFSYGYEVRNSVFKDLGGFAIDFGFVASPVIVDSCEFENTQGIDLFDTKLTVSNSNFRNNTLIANIVNASIAQFYNNEFIENGITESPISITRSNLEIVDCRFIANSADEGGVFVYSSNQNNTTLIDRSVFRENRAEIRGGVFATFNAGQILVRNSLFDGNSANRGGVLFQRSSSGFDFLNCTFNNSTVDNIGAIALNREGRLTFTNSIFWNSIGTNTIADNLGANNIEVFHTLVDENDLQQGITFNNVIFNQDPLFTDAENSDFVLLSGSPAINAGLNQPWDSISNPVDLAVNPRIQGGIIDMGALEGASQAPDTIDVVYVDLDANGGNNGSSWSDAFTDLKDAIDLAQIAIVKEIWIAEGLYGPEQAQISPLGDKVAYYSAGSLNLYGGFNGTETERSERDPLANITALCGDLGEVDNIADDANIILQLNVQDSETNSIISGLAFKGAYSHGLDIYDQGLSNQYTLEDAKFDQLGGMAIIGEAEEFIPSIKISQSLFRQTQGLLMVGEILLLEVLNTDFVDNGSVAQLLGSESDAIFENCQFLNNGDTTDLDLVLDALPILSRWPSLPQKEDFYNAPILTAEFEMNFTDCRFDGNIGQKGGVFYLAENDVPELFADRCIFSNNTASIYGGVFANDDGARRSEITNSLFENNKAPLGGILYHSDGGLFEFFNCTFVGSESKTQGSLIYNTEGIVSLVNCISWDSKGDELIFASPATNGTKTEVSFSLLDINEAPANVITENVIFNQDPLFTDPENGIYTLLPISPVIDAGTNEPWEDTENPLDLAKNSRIQLDKADMGAYEAPEKQTPPEVLAFEAECASFSDRWNIILDPLASGGQLVSYPEGTLNLAGPPTDPEDYINFSINVKEAGQYYIWTRNQALGGSRDSWWVIVNGGNPVKFNGIPDNLDYQWTRVFDSDLDSEPILFNLQAGDNLIQFGVRESLTYLDKVFVSVQTEAPEGEGPSDPDCEAVDACTGEEILYVDRDKVGEANNGRSWDEAFFDLRLALKTAALCPDVKEIWIADGEYYNFKLFELTGNDSTFTATFSIDRPIKLIGGFAGFESDPAQRNLNTNLTLLSSNGDGGQESVEKADYVLYGFDVIDGVRIEGDSSIGAARAELIRNTTFSGLMTGYQQVLAGEEIDISKSLFENNKLGIEMIGAAFFLDSVDFNANIQALKVTELKGTRSSSYRHCTFTNNGNNDVLGSLQLQGNHTFELCTFESNEANKGGVFYLTGNTLLQVENSLFRGNFADQGGTSWTKNGLDGQTRLNFVNTLFIENVANNGGVSYDTGEGAELNYFNCSFYNNFGQDESDILSNAASGSLINFTNCAIPTQAGSALFPSIASLNTGVQVLNSYLPGTDCPTGVTCTESIYEGIVGDVGYNDPQNGDLSLSSASPLIDEGTNLIWQNISDPLDFAANPRIVNDFVDIGAFEFQGPKEEVIYVFEAECASFSDRWEIILDPLASGGQSVNYAAGGNSLGGPSADPADYINFTINVEEAGQYYIWTRNQALGGSRDSWWVIVNGGDPAKFNNIPPDLDYQWTRVFDSDEGVVPILFDLKAGENLIQFGWRESLTYLDKIFVSAQTEAPVGEGPVDPNCEPVDPCVGPEIIYVDADKVGGANNGRSWDEAYFDLRIALKAAALCNNVTQIWIADGTYRNSKFSETTTPDGLVSVAFLAERPITLIGGFAGFETDPFQRNLNQNITIISSDTGEEGDSSDDAEYVLYGFGAIDGVSVTGENSVGIARAELIKNTTFTNLKIGYQQLLAGEEIEISTSAFEGNEVGVEMAGASFFFDIVTFRENIQALKVDQLLGQRTSVFRSSVFMNNGASEAELSGTLELQGNYFFENCTFEDNEAELGGVFHLTGDSKVEVERSVFRRNIADQGAVSWTGGSGVELSISNSLLLNNIGGLGAISYDKGEGTEIDFINNTFYGNLGEEEADILYKSGAGSNISFINCAIPSQLGEEIFASTNPNTRNAGISVEFSLLPDFGCSPGVSCFAVLFENVAGPLGFEDAENGSFVLLPGSPLIDRGINTPWVGVANPVDFANSPRIVDGTVDIGAFEFQALDPDLADVFEAECVFVGRNWQIVSSPVYSNGLAVLSPDDQNTLVPPQIKADLIQFTVDIEEAGDYYVWSRSLASNASSDSYWVRVFEVESTPPTDWVRFNEIPTGEDFLWNRVHDSDNNNTPVVFNLTPATYFVEFGWREPDIILDKVVILPTSENSPQGLGPLAESCDPLARRGVVSTEVEEALVYPNPTEGNTLLHLDMDYQGMVEIRITDLAGKELLFISKEKNDTIVDWQLPVDKLSSGILLVNVRYGENRKVLRLAKQ